MKSLCYVEVDVPDFAGSSPEVTTTFRFAQPTDYLPNGIDAIASIRNVSFTPATLSLGEHLGQRASLTISFTDHRHIFGNEPFTQGSFWGKWRGRYGTKLRGRSIRLIRGILGHSLAEMDTRHYVIESTDGPTPDGVYTITAKDLLKLADDDRAQAPKLSNGSLAGSINAAITTAILNPAGIGNLEYPASGFLCLGGKEVVSFTRSGDSLAMVRGQLGTTAIPHDAGERAQRVLRYAGNDVADIIADLFVNYAGMPADGVPLAEWKAETAANLSVLYAATITEPTSVKKLVSELINQAALALWWDDQAKRVRLQVLREIATDAASFSEENIVEGSLRVQDQADKRISQIWTYYTQRDPTDQADNADNYASALATVDLAREDQYGSPVIRKVTGRWVPTISAAERLNGIQMSCFRDPPRRFSFDLFRSESVDLAQGAMLRWWANQNQAGVAQPARIQITRVNVEADFIHVEAEEMLASGVVVLTNTVFLATAGALLGWQVPATWNNANNTVELLAAGGGGFGLTGNGGRGGGGAAYSRSANLSLTPGSTVPYQIGLGGFGRTSLQAATDGGDSWFGAASFAAALVAAKGGTAATGRTTGGIGGQASAGVGQLKTSGGDGGNGAVAGESRSGGGGGGAAGGPNGDGGDGGGNNSGDGQDGGAGGGGADGGGIGTSGQGQNGGQGGNNRFNFGGGVTGSPNGKQGGGGRGGNSTFTDEVTGDGGTGQPIWTQTVAPIISAGPGGGAEGGGSARAGGRGGKYGGGGGGGGQGQPGGDAEQGIIIITWKEAA